MMVERGSSPRVSSAHFAWKGGRGDVKRSGSAGGEA